MGAEYLKYVGNGNCADSPLHICMLCGNGDGYTVRCFIAYVGMCGCELYELQLCVWVIWM